MDYYDPLVKAKGRKRLFSYCLTIAIIWVFSEPIFSFIDNSVKSCELFQYADPNP